jgi:hypothetical protein
MSRGAHPTNTASDLCGSFTSRNNNLDGDWSIGKLRSLAERYGQTIRHVRQVTSATTALGRQPPFKFDCLPILDSVFTAPNGVCATADWLSIGSEIRKK